MPRRPRKERLNVILMKAGTSLEQVIRPDMHDLRRIRIRDGLPFDGYISIKASPPAAPRWQSFVQSGSSDALGVLVNQSSACLIVIEVQNRIFSVAFGYARHWIDDSRIERRFGMIVTLNAVDPNRLRSIDREEFDVINRMTRSQTSVSASIENFGLDIQRDLVRSVSGQPADDSFASHLTGADNLIVTAALTFDELGGKCAEALRYFGQTQYRNRYPWIDNFVRVRDPGLIGELEQMLLEELQTGAPLNAFLTPPKMLDTQEPRGYLYPHERRGSELHMDLLIEEFLTHEVPLNELTIVDVKRLKIREFAMDGAGPSDEFSIYASIVYEVERESKLYVLSRSEWFEIDQDYVRSVITQLAGIPDHLALNLCSARPVEPESNYNRRAADESQGFLALLDRQVIQYGGGHSSIEICDLLSLNKDFIHVKAKTKSSTLSHLFSQGLNSAQAFRDSKFRELAREACPPSHRSLFEGDPHIPEFTVTFAIITRAQEDLRAALPFFSKQSLANAVRMLINMGYRAKLKKIPVTVPI